MTSALWITILTYAWLFHPLQSLNDPAPTTLAPGKQPQLSTGPQGAINMTFGRNDSIFYATFHPHSKGFSKPQYVGMVRGMHLGMTRGPQLASSQTSSMITAMDTAGNIHTFLCNEATKKWR